MSDKLSDEMPITSDICHRSSLEPLIFTMYIDYLKKKKSNHMNVDTKAIVDKHGQISKSVIIIRLVVFDKLQSSV